MELKPFESKSALDPRNVYFIETSMGEEAIKELEEAVSAEYERDAEGVSQTNAGGWQSAGQTVTVTENDPVPSIVNPIVDKLKPSFYFKWWYNINKYSNSNDIHTHSYQVIPKKGLMRLLTIIFQVIGVPNKKPFWSSVMYVSTPKGCGNINFYNFHILWSLLNRYKPTRPIARKYWKPVLSFEPQQDKTYIFHSTRFHSVDANTSGQSRISMAMDWG